MKIKFYCPIWGMKDLPLAAALRKIKSSGYDGAEIPLNPDTMNIQDTREIFDDNGLEFLIQYPYAREGSFSKMRDVFFSRLDILLKLNPVMINCHTGKDYFSFEQNLEFINGAGMLSKASGITIAHETHRGRFSYSAVVMKDYLDAVPELKLTADFSHWCVVAESLLEDQEETITRVIPHCVYIHARVGYAQGPQVPNPAAPEYKKELTQHVKWWQQIVDHHILAGTEELIITPEFGPPRYMHTLPFSNEPVADQFKMNLFMKDFLTKKLKQ